VNEAEEDETSLFHQSERIVIHCFIVGKQSCHFKGDKHVWHEKIQRDDSAADVEGRPFGLKGARVLHPGIVAGRSLEETGAFAS